MYCIRNVTRRVDYLYWLDGHGWVEEEYSVFTEEEMKNYTLPDDGEWEEC